MGKSQMDKLKSTERLLLMHNENDEIKEILPSTGNEISSFCCQQLSKCLEDRTLGKNSTNIVIARVVLEESRAKILDCPNFLNDKRCTVHDHHFQGDICNKNEICNSVRDVCKSLIKRENIISSSAQ